MLDPPKTRDLNRPVLISVESYVPKGHFYRHLHRVLDLSFVRDLAADRYAVSKHTERRRIRNFDFEKPFDTPFTDETGLY